jgi:hypothetical protein
MSEATTTILEGTEESIATPAKDSCSEQPLPRPGRNRRRSQRVLLCMPITVQAGSDRSPFTEVAQTLVVNAHGALIAMETEVVVGQQIRLQSPVTLDVQLCRVAHVGDDRQGKKRVGVEFSAPSPRFWQITFPPEDWS